MLRWEFIQTSQMLVNFGCNLFVELSTASAFKQQGIQKKRYLYYGYA